MQIPAERCCCCCCCFHIEYTRNELAFVCKDALPRVRIRDPNITHPDRQIGRTPCMYACNKMNSSSSTSSCMYAHIVYQPRRARWPRCRPLETELVGEIEFSRWMHSHRLCVCVCTDFLLGRGTYRITNYQHRMQREKKKEEKQPQHKKHIHNQTAIGTLTSRLANGAVSQGISTPSTSVPFPLTVSATLPLPPPATTAASSAFSACSLSRPLKSYSWSPGLTIRLGIVPSPSALPFSENEMCTVPWSCVSGLENSTHCSAVTMSTVTTVGFGISTFPPRLAVVSFAMRLYDLICIPMSLLNPVFFFSSTPRY